MDQPVKPGLSIEKYELPQSLAASLDIEELERRLALSEMALEVDVMNEADYAEYAAMGPWEVSGTVVTGPNGTTGTATAKKSW